MDLVYLKTVFKTSVVMTFLRIVCVINYLSVAMIVIAEIFTLLCAMLLAMSTGMAVIVVTIHSRHDDDAIPPDWLSHIVMTKLAKVVCVTITNKNKNHNIKSLQNGNITQVNCKGC